MKILKTYKQLFEKQSFKNYDLTTFFNIKNFVKEFDVNIVDENGFSLLIYVIKELKVRRLSEDYILKIVKYLVENGANINHITNVKDNALNWSVFHELYNVSKYLIENGINIDNQDIYGSSPLMTTSVEGAYKIIDLLINNGCNVNLVDDKNQTALHIVSKYYKSYNNETKYKKSILRLLESDIDWNIEDETNKDFLDYLQPNSIYPDYNSNLINEIKEKFPEKYKKYIREKEAKKFNI